MKKVLFRSIFLLILYTLASLYIAVFNWQIFIVKLNINLGFGVIEFPPFFLFFLLGFVIIGILSWTNYVIRLRRMIYDLEHGMEVGKLKDKLTSSRIKKFMFEEDNLNFLKERIGVVDIQKKQDELAKLVSDLQQKPEQKR